MPSGRLPGCCKVCRHPERVRIELAVAGGASRRAVARKFNLNHLSIGRHWNRHVTDARKASLIIGPVQREALAARVAEESESVLDHHRAVRAGLYQLYDAALEAGDRSGGANVAGRLTEVNNSIARFTGQIATSPLISNTTINFIGSPEYTRLRDGLLSLVRAHPEVRPEVVAILDGLDTQMAPPERPALEHSP